MTAVAGSRCDDGRVTSPASALAALRDAAASGLLDEFCRRHRVRVLTVFGSAARGEPDPRDLDVGVLTESDEPLDVGVAVAELAALADFDDVDLVHLNRGGPLIRERALVGSVGLYESEPAALANAQMAAMAERVETDPMRRMNLRMLAG